MENHFAYIVCVLKIGITKHDNFYANKVAKGTFLFMNLFIKRTFIFKVKQQKKTSQGQSNQQSKKKSYLALDFFTQQVPHGGVSQSHSRGDTKVIETFHNKKIQTR